MTTNVQPADHEQTTSHDGIHPCKSQGERSHNTEVTYTSFDYSNDDYSRASSIAQKHYGDDGSSVSCSSVHLSEVVLMMEREMMELKKDVVSTSNEGKDTPVSLSCNKSGFVSTYDDGLSGELSRLAAAQESLRAEIDIATKTSMGWLSSSSSSGEDSSLIMSGACEFEEAPSLAETNSTISASSKSSDDDSAIVGMRRPSSSLYVKCGSYDKSQLQSSLSFDGNELNLSPTDSEISKHRFELFAISDDEEDNGSVSGDLLRKESSSSPSCSESSSSSSCSFESSEDELFDGDEDNSKGGAVSPVYTDNSGLHCAEGGVLDIMSRLMLVSVWNNKLRRKKSAR
mmetsp:Transcript_22083/g.33133  ORF Transcript_22083/g.33133 Transcript_22083/m.33133 type:complete len:343 (-) Transcript_22083:263-1291(-)